MQYPRHLTKTNILRALLIASPAFVSFLFDTVEVAGYSVSDSVIILLLSGFGAMVYLYQSEKTNRSVQDAERKFDRLKVIDGQLAVEDEAGNVTILT